MGVESWAVAAAGFSEDLAHSVMAVGPHIGPHSAQLLPKAVAGKRLKVEAAGGCKPGRDMYPFTEQLCKYLHTDETLN